METSTEAGTAAVAGRSGAAQMRQSFTWWSFAPAGTDAERLLSGAAEIGFQGVELLDEALFGLARRHGLVLTTHRAADSIERGLNRTEQHASLLRELETNLRLAERWQIPNLICFSGNRGGQSDAEGIARTAEGLARMAPLAADAGVTLLLEALNSKVDHPDYACDSSAWGVAVLERLDAPNVKLLYDVYHMQVMEGDLIRTVRRQQRHIGHVHAAGNPGRAEIGGEQEIHYPAVFRALRDSGYRGYIGHEFVPSGEPLAALRQAFTLCAETLGQL